MEREARVVFLSAELESLDEVVNQRELGDCKGADAGKRRWGKLGSFPPPFILYLFL